MLVVFWTILRNLATLKFLCLFDTRSLRFYYDSWISFFFFLVLSETKKWFWSIVIVETGEKMAQHLLHGTLHATIYEVDALHGGGVRQGFLGKVYYIYI